MRIIAFGDIHMTVQMCRNIPEIADADLLIITGDLTNYGRKKEAREVLDKLLGFNQNLVALLGNLDHFEINDYLEQLDFNLHGQAKLIQSKICIMGAGGSNITPFETPTEFSEKELHSIIMKAHSQAAEYITLAKPMNSHIPLIFVSHTPPLETRVDKLANGQHVGSKAVRDYIEEQQPDLCLTGHIHEARGEDYIGKTHIINPGMLQHGGWIDITLTNTRLSATLK